MPSYGATLTSGVQDISALLPLLGTEQCEDHAGSALSNGFLFAAVTPLSVFGTLGLARAGFKVLVASISLPGRGFLGAQKLRYAGFKPSGVNLELIMMDPERPDRHLAETRLDALLEKFRVADANKGSKPLWWGTSKLFRWNLKMTVFTAAFSALNTVAYVELVVNKNDLGRRLAFIFPLTRILGGFLTVAILQFLLEMRIGSIINARHVFWELDTFVKSRILETPLLEDFPDLVWSSEVASETCLASLWKSIHLSDWEVEAPLHDPLPRSQIDEEAEEESLPAIQQTLVKDYQASTGVDLEGLGYATPSARRYRVDALKKELQYAMHDIDDIVGLSYNYYIWTLTTLMLLGILGCIVGYIGCFSVVQGVPSGNIQGPLLWLGLEVFLSLIRIIVWSTNPKWDDARGGIKFVVGVSPSSPLTTHPRFIEDITTNEYVPVQRAAGFLELVKQHSGNVPEPFSYSNISLLYTLLRKRVQDRTREDPVLCVTVFEHLQRTARVCWADDKGNLSFKAATIEFDPTGPNPRILIQKEITDISRDAIMHDPNLLSALKEHYFSIVGQVDRDDSGERFIRCDWSLKQMEETAGSSSPQIGRFNRILNMRFYPYLQALDWASADS